MEPPLFIAPPTLTEGHIDPRDQEVFDSCGTCPDCQNMLALGLVKQNG